MAPIFIGISLLREGRFTKSIAQIRESLASLEKTGHRAWVPYVRAVLGEAYARDGDLENGLRCVEQSLERIESQGERVHLAEVRRLKGWMLAQQGRTNEAEICVRDAIAIAAQQHAKSWELRSATTLAQLLADRGKWSAAAKADAENQLRPVFEWFTEGAGTRDYQEAKDLLRKLQ